MQIRGWPTGAGSSPTPAGIQRAYLTLILGNTLAASFIWGINTLFLLDAGLSNAQAFAANAFFTLGMIIFEIPTGVVADTIGRRRSYQLGTLTLAGATAAYWGLWVARGPFWAWAVVSILLGLGFTFFSGAVEAWLVDALHAAGYDGQLETVLGRGMVASGVAMLVGSVLGGLVAQWTNLGVPFLMRVAVLLLMFGVASLVMHDHGFTPAQRVGAWASVRRTFSESLTHGLGNPPVRWVMLASPFLAGVGIYVFYALQPLLLQRWGDQTAYLVAGSAAALVAGSQIVGGLAAPRIRRLFARRTTVLILSCLLGSVMLAGIAVVGGFWGLLALATCWALVGAAAGPVQGAYINAMIPSAQRATVLSFASLMGSAGGVAIQPALGRVADVNGYPASMGVGAVLNLLAAPMLLASRRCADPADRAV